MLFPAKGVKRLGRQKQQMSTLTAFQLTIHRSPGANSIQRAETEADSRSLAVSIFFFFYVCEIGPRSPQCPLQRAWVCSLSPWPDYSISSAHLGGALGSSVW